MDFQNTKTFFMWCTVINGGLLIISVITGIVGLDFVYSIHGRLFQISRETFNMAYYFFIGLYKIVWLVFNSVPYIALLIIGKKSIQPVAWGRPSLQRDFSKLCGFKKSIRFKEVPREIRPAHQLYVTCISNLSKVFMAIKMLWYLKYQRRYHRSAVLVIFSINLNLVQTCDTGKNAHAFKLIKTFEILSDISPTSPFVIWRFLRGMCSPPGSCISITNPSVPIFEENSSTSKVQNN